MKGEVEVLVIVREEEEVAIEELGTGRDMVQEEGWLWEVVEVEEQVVLVVGMQVVALVTMKGSELELLQKLVEVVGIWCWR